MPRHTLKLLALLTAFAVAPAMANGRAAALPSGLHYACPHARAAAAARNAAIFAHLERARKIPTRITLIDRVTKVDSLSELGGGTAFMRP
jgi:hypothetical protein